METIKAIAMLCSILAGTGPAEVIEASQIKCHAFYARCAKEKKPIIDCMIDRPKEGK